MSLRISIFILGIVGNTAEAAEKLLTEGSASQKSHCSIQHLPQDIIINIFNFVDYPTLGKCSQICKTWRTLIAEKLPIKQRYILKYLVDFVDKNNPSRTIKKFEEIFLDPLTDAATGKITLDEIIEEIQEDLGVDKEQAYQALLDTKLMKSCPSMRVIFRSGRYKLGQKELIFPYTSANFLTSVLNSIQEDQLIFKYSRIKELETQQDVTQIFGFKNVCLLFQPKITKLAACKLNLKIIPRQIQRLSNLQFLTLRHNQLTYLPPEIRQLTNLQNLELRNNQLSNLTPEIGQLINLTILSLENNKLTQLPPEINQLKSLQHLYLSDNQLSSLPPEIGGLKNLIYLYLYNNHLSNLPATMRGLTNLKGLGLSNNQLTNFPSEIRQLTNLGWIDLSNNQITSIPPEINGALSGCKITY